VSCQNQAFTGIHHDGGYAEVMISKASGLVSVPDDLSSVDAAPLLCAGLTTFSALRNAPAKAGDLVAVLGIGQVDAHRTTRRGDRPSLSIGSVHRV
jgi:alcohol dehydrogenase, propanol-preferring